MIGDYRMAKDALLFFALAAGTFAAMYWLVGAGFAVSLICAVSILAVGISRGLAARAKK
jgi:hypothetical protein